MLPDPCVMSPRPLQPSRLDASNAQVPSRIHADRIMKTVLYGLMSEIGIGSETVEPRPVVAVSVWVTLVWFIGAPADE